MRVALSVASILMFGVASEPGFAQGSANPTYTKDVAPILFENCASCHRAGQIGPMSLLSYDEVRPWAKSIAKNVADGAMPPWDADHGFGPWKDDRSLSQEEKDTIVRWVEQGAKRGNPKDMPSAPSFPQGDWRLGEPDLEIVFEKYEVPAGGPDLFHDHLYQTELKEDKWITDVEILPGANEVVHHVILWQGERGENNPQGWVGAWGAGADPMQFPEGTGRMLKKGSMIRGDMHYHPDDEAHIDQTRVGFHFANGDVEKELANVWVMNDTFAIPAGTTIECVAHFDNSVGNAANPDPTKEIYFGPQSYDEMMIGFIDYIVDDGISPTVNTSPFGGRGGSQNDQRGDRRGSGESGTIPLLKRFDENKDGKLSMDEVPDSIADLFQQIDKNTDGFIEINEIRAFSRN